MRRLTEWTAEDLAAYNLRGDGQEFTIFQDSQRPRVDLARGLIHNIIGREKGRDRMRIVELGCSAGDISGYFSWEDHDVMGVDLVPGAVDAARARYPQMTVMKSDATAMTPTPCDILVLTEFLEHIDDPIGLVKRWLPLARYAVIGHPVDDPGGIEPGHAWSYNERDFDNWAILGGHQQIESRRFAMGPFEKMIIGSSKRVEG